MLICVSSLLAVPQGFQRVLETLGQARTEGARLHEIPSPRSADFSVALALDSIDGVDAFGRFVVLFGGDFEDAYESPVRIVTMLESPIDAEVAADPTARSVFWSFLHDAFDSTGASVRALGGSVSIESTQSFPEIDRSELQHRVQIRASWSPKCENVADDLEAWILLARRIQV